MMNVEFMMQYTTYFLMAVGVLAFLVSAIVQAIKELPGLQRGHRKDAVRLRLRQL